jgi:hypothetical protein
LPNAGDSFRREAGDGAIDAADVLDVIWLYRMYVMNPI